jgi:3-hydroxyisobutyrate dehydrogenase-like beta-hydroxyacid dehydrogenase
MTSETPVVGLLHPGEMGAALGARLVAAGVEVLWDGTGRREPSRLRAREAGLVETFDLADLVERATVVVSICPPANALVVATSVAECGFDGLYVDANAVSPATARRVAVACRTHFVDADVIGGPPRAGTAAASATTVYASGERAAEVVALLGASGVRSVDLGADPVAASALKMCYAAWSKGSWALLAAAAGAARRLGVEDALRDEWSHSQPGLVERLERGAAGNAPKAWRFSAELAEIATTMRDAGLPGGFGDAASELYGRLAAYRDEPPPSIDELLDRLIG